MSIQIMEQVKRLSRQLAAAEERIRALETKPYDGFNIETVAEVADRFVRQHEAEKHTPGRKRSQAED